MISKIKFYIIITLFFTSYNGYTNKIRLGLHSGINFSTISAANAPDEFNSGKGFLPAIVFGVNAEILINDDYSFLGEINYSTKGYTMDNSGIRIRSYSKYVELPLKLKFNTSNAVGIEFGPYFGFAFREYLKNNLTKSKVYGSIGNDINSEIDGITIHRILFERAFTLSISLVSM